MIVLTELREGSNMLSDLPGLVGRVPYTANDPLIYKELGPSFGRWLTPAETSGATDV